MNNEITIGQYTIQINESELTAKCWETKKTGSIRVMFNYRFITIESMSKYVTDYAKKIFNGICQKQQQQINRINDKKNHGIEVGQIYYNSWGYDQTNVNFYMITSVKGQKIEFVEIAQNAEFTQWDYGYTMPDSSKIISDKMTALATGKQKFKVWKSRYQVSIFDGKPKYFSTGY
jgi:archaellum component FlaF (FlaF/FlaG flagellin family)